MSQRPPPDINNDVQQQQQQLIVRFASSLPDLPLTISDPYYTIVLSLKVLIRKHLTAASQSCSNCRLNLIYAGKLLHNNEVIGTALKLGQRHAACPPPPPPPTKKGKDKGKEPVQPAVVALAPLYVHCSLGEILSAQELANEVSQAAAAEQALRNSHGRSTFLPNLRNEQGRGGEDDSENVPALPIHHEHQLRPPAGFDRLLGSGWTADDVASLRASFLAHLSYSHTPSTMPTGDALRLLEERWLDSTGPGGSGGIGNDSSLSGNAEQVGPLNEQDAALLQQFDDDEAGALDDGLWGSMVGFFWPWAALWRFREPGVWTERRQMMVLLGVTINLLFGFMRLVTSREDSF